MAVTQDIVDTERAYVEQYAQSTLKAAYLINGGAAVALLAFIGGAEHLQRQVIVGLAEATAIFGFGVLAAAGSTCLAYITLFNSMRAAQGRPGGDWEKWRYAAIGTAILSLCLFFVGTLWASCAIRSLS